MKWKLSTGVCVLITLALVLFGLLFGTVSGFTDDRGQVTALLTGENGLMDMLGYRGADGLNLCAVAKRHLTGDADAEALYALSLELTNENHTLAQKKKANEKLDAAVAAVAAKLAATPSFQASERDQRYVSMLESDLNSLTQSALSATYQSAAEKFNQRLNDSPIGSLARLLGVKPCELYE